MGERMTEFQTWKIKQGFQRGPEETWETEGHWLLIWTGPYRQLVGPFKSGQAAVEYGEMCIRTGLTVKMADHLDGFGWLPREWQAFLLDAAPVAR